MTLALVFIAGVVCGSFGTILAIALGRTASMEGPKR